MDWEAVPGGESNPKVPSMNLKQTNSGSSTEIQQEPYCRKIIAMH